jgi:hypothetical protein
MIAYCGLACFSCPIHLATLEKDLARQAKMRIDYAFDPASQERLEEIRKKK